MTIKYARIKDHMHNEVIWAPIRDTKLQFWHCCCAVLTKGFTSSTLDVQIFNRNRSNWCSTRCSNSEIVPVINVCFARCVKILVSTTCTFDLQRYFKRSQINGALER